MASYPIILSNGEIYMTTQVFLLLDMTSSMNDGKELTIDACNEFISGQKSARGAVDSAFTLAVFNSNIGLERIVRDVPMENVPLIEHEHYSPDGATPLYDAIGQGMDLLGSHKEPVLFIIQTDGEENSSQQFTRDDIIRHVAEKTAAGWQFVYLGCDIDAMGQGTDLGIAAGNTMSYARPNANIAFKTLETSTKAYMDGGSETSANFFERTGIQDSNSEVYGPL
jgi:hypothetical protein